jgi:flagellar hook-basal body complex protein FliE
VNQDQVQADRAIKELVAGRGKNIHETMLAVERADTSLKLMMQVRNKVLDAYREIMRMQV